MNCPACGHTLSPGARFCNKCGTLVSFVAASPVEAPAFSFADSEATVSEVAVASVSESGDQVTLCPECGKNLKSGTRFCTGCGTTIAVTGAASAAGVSLPVATPDEQAHALPEAAPVVAGPVDDVDLSLSFDDTRPPEVERSVLDSLPLHPVQRGMPDFELPDLPAPRDVPKPAAMQGASLNTPAPVNFEQFDSFEEMERQVDNNGGGSGLKWLVVGALAVLLVGGGGWFGYKHYAGSSKESVPAADAQPAQDGVAEGESVVPSEAATATAGVQDAAATAVDAASVPLEAVVPAPVATTDVVGAQPADQTAVQAAAPSDQVAPAAVTPVHVLRDSPASGASSSAAPTRQKSRNKSLDSLLD